MNCWRKGMNAVQAAYPWPNYQSKYCPGWSAWKLKWVLPGKSHNPLGNRENGRTEVLLINLTASKSVQIKHTWSCTALYKQQNKTPDGTMGCKNTRFTQPWPPNSCIYFPGTWQLMQYRNGNTAICHRVIWWQTEATQSSLPLPMLGYYNQLIILLEKQFYTKHSKQLKASSIATWAFLQKLSAWCGILAYHRQLHTDRFYFQ